MVRDNGFYPVARILAKAIIHGFGDKVVPAGDLLKLFHVFFCRVVELWIIYLYLRHIAAKRCEVLNPVQIVAPPPVKRVVIQKDAASLDTIVVAARQGAVWNGVELVVVDMPQL